MFQKDCCNVNVENRLEVLDQRQGDGKMIVFVIYYREDNGLTWDGGNGVEMID